MSRARDDGTLCCVSVTPQYRVRRCSAMVDRTLLGMAFASPDDAGPLPASFGTQPPGDTRMQWTTPSFTDMRFGFEITMYIATR
jgi:coenzyme PQQ precursor peptide PqqA